MDEQCLKSKKEMAAFGLLWLSFILVVAMGVKAADFFVDSAKSAKLVTEAALLGNYDPNDIQKYFARSNELVKELKEKNLFVPPTKKSHPVKEVSGILGDMALINGKWYKVGDKVSDANIVSIDPTVVTIEWAGKKKDFAPIATASKPEPKKEKNKAEVEKKPAPVKKKDVAPAPVEETVVAIPVEDDPLAWMGVELSPRVREFLMKQLENASDEKIAKAKEQWNKMSDEKKQETIDQLERHLDSM